MAGSQGDPRGQPLPGPQACRPHPGPGPPDPQPPRRRRQPCAPPCRRWGSRGKVQERVAGGAESVARITGPDHLRQTWLGTNSNCSCRRAGGASGLRRTAGRPAALCRASLIRGNSATSARRRSSPGRSAQPRTAGEACFPKREYSKRLTPYALASHRYAMASAKVGAVAKYLLS